MPQLPFARLTATVVALVAVAVAGQAASTASPAGYLVQPGDSLWAISQRAGVSMQQLAAANHMQLSDVLLIGRHLTIPGHARRAATSPPPAVAASRGAAVTAGAVTGPGGAGDFCASFTPTAGSRGLLPSQLAASPSRLALRRSFVRWGHAYGVNPALLEAIAWQESGWQQGVVSSAQAVGVGQLLPVTADFVSNQLLGQRLDITSSSDNIKMMARYVAYLQGQLPGTCRTVAGYYEGSANMARFGVFPETRPYVANVEYLMAGFS